MVAGPDERRSEGRTRHLVTDPIPWSGHLAPFSRVKRHDGCAPVEITGAARWLRGKRTLMPNAEFNRMIRVLAAIAFVAIGLTACAAGSPGVVRDPVPTATPRQIAAAVVTSDAPAPANTATASPEPTDTPAPEPTKKAKTRKTGTPVPEATERVPPPGDDGSGFSQVFDRGASGRSEIALTFDAGADRGFAERILDTLDEYGVKASFGITGHWANENPDLVKRMADEGHMIFNHTWTHRSFTGYSTANWDEGVLTPDERAAELDDTAREIEKVTGGYIVAPYFRPPYGDLDDSALADLAASGYRVTVMWSCDSFGWNGATVDQIIERCGLNAEAGDIILMHVGAESLDAEALPGLIESLQDQGFELVTVEQLLQP